MADRKNQANEQNGENGAEKTLVIESVVCKRIEGNDADTGYRQCSNITKEENRSARSDQPVPFPEIGNMLQNCSETDSQCRIHIPLQKRKTACR